MWSEELGYIILFLSLFLVPLFLFGVYKLFEHFDKKKLQKEWEEMEKDRQMRKDLGIPGGAKLHLEDIRPDRKPGEIFWDNKTFVYVVDGQKLDFTRFTVECYKKDSPWREIDREERQRQVALHHRMMVCDYPKVYGYTPYRPWTEPVRW